MAHRTCDIYYRALSGKNIASSWLTPRLHACLLKHNIRELYNADILLLSSIKHLKEHHQQSQVRIRKLSVQNQVLQFTSKVTLNRLHSLSVAQPLICTVSRDNDVADAKD